MIPDWTKVDPNPVSPQVHRFLADVLAQRNAGSIRDYRAFLSRYVAGREVLDIGVVDHDHEHMAAGGWLHELIASSAKRVVGVDILEEESAYLREQGYDVRCVDATSDVDLGERFDCVVLGDVIEHVSNPVALLEFSGRHLAEGGTVLVKTPNPFYLKTVFATFRERMSIANAEHVSWVTPTLALELGRRAGLNIYHYWLRQVRSPSLLKRLPFTALERVRPNNELLAFDFVYEYGRSDRM